MTDTHNDLNKVTPRVNHFDHHKYKFYIYVYLNPFKKVKSTYQIGTTPYHFSFAPIYIGKATGMGYRHNQHIAEYLKNGSEEYGNIKIHNEFKRKTFKELENNMKTHASGELHLPRNWEDYQKDWVIILKGYDDQASLMLGEKEMVSSIGTVRKNTGPLVNAILG